MILRKGDYFLPTDQGTFRARNLVRIEATDDAGNDDVGWGNVVTVIDDHSGDDPMKWTTAFFLKDEVLEWLADHADPHGHLAGRGARVGTTRSQDDGTWASDPVHGTVKHVSSGFYKLTMLFADHEVAKEFVEHFGRTPSPGLTP